MQNGGTDNYLPGIVTLMYHQVDDASTNPWGICVSVKHFEEQVRFLRDNFNVISLDQLIGQLTTGNIADNSICITFDDGYADNYINAKPILEKYACPATFFIPTEFIGHSIPFWWDELEIIILHSITLPQQLSLSIRGKKHLFILDETELTKEALLLHANWRWYQQPPTNRCTIFLKIWKKLRPLFSDEINSCMACIRKWAGSDNHTGTQRVPMNENQLRDLSQNPLFTIAMHTHTHPDLKGKAKKFQAEEISLCKKVLEEKFGIHCNSLAYPYGRYDNTTLSVVKLLGVTACFTTSPGLINALSDMATLSRLQVSNGDGNSLKRQLKEYDKLHQHL